jgi:tRNA A37 threonylcarbamoyladenosine biosynthesis protein TsaE
LYRLTSKEVDDLGLDDLMLEGGAVAVEWPDRLPRTIAGALRVDIQYVDDGTRTITIER